MKKLLSWVAVLVLTLSLIGAASVTVSAETISTPIGEYRLLEDGTVELTHLNDATLIFDIKPSGYTLTGIGERACANCTVLGTIPIPDTVTYIADGAFADCQNITEMTIPKSVLDIGTGIFEGCSSLATIHVEKSNPYYTDLGENMIVNYLTATLVACGVNVTEIPAHIEIIEDGVFKGSEALTEITLPPMLLSIGNNAFADCRNLTTVNCPDSVDWMGYGVFENTPWYEAQPEGLVYIGKMLYAYKGTCPAEVEIKADTVGIAGGAFFMQENLKKITIPDTVGVIGPDAFKACVNLEEVTLGRTVRAICDHAFFWCDSLKSITVPASVTYIASEWEALGYHFDADYNFVPIEGFTIYGYPNTAAEAYANEKGFPFVALAPPVSLGDADEDGNITMKDVLLVRKSIAGLVAGINRYAADVDGDGNVTMKDVLMIRKFIAGLVDHLGA